LFLGMLLSLLAAVGLFRRAWWGPPAATNVVSRAYLDRLLGMSASEQR
jgi:hypothetical protein